MSWSADYNIVRGGERRCAGPVAWVTVDNQSGKQFEHPHQLMAGDVTKCSRRPGEKCYSGAIAGGFLRAAGIQSKRLYAYDGVRTDRTTALTSICARRRTTAHNPTARVVMREFANSNANHLACLAQRAGALLSPRPGRPGGVHGENQIDHTAKDETVRVYTGNAFDIKGSGGKPAPNQMMPGNALSTKRSRSSYEHKREPATIRVIEHLYRWSNWVITQESATTASGQPDHRIRSDAPANGESTLSYTVHYTW